MNVTLTITAETLAEALAQFGQPIGYVAAPPPGTVYCGASAVEAPPAPIADPRLAEVTAEPAKRTPGRPRKDGTPAQPKPPAPESAPTTPVYVVRRYGGATEGESTDSGTAAETLIGLIREAGDKEALDSLVRVNSETVWPDDRWQEISDAEAAARSALALAAANPAAKHFTLDGSPLLSLTLDKQGAMDGVRAVVAADGGGYTATKEFMESLGVARVSVLADADPNLGKIATWCAARLGLPVVLAG